jgi:hypothetical protein
MSNSSDINEPRVSAAYREVATETTPAHLDRKVLEAARAGTQTRYGLARAWMRPLAWAATIALSFAFILQLTLEDEMPANGAIPIPTDRVDLAPAPASTRSEILELREAADEAILKAKELDQRAVSQSPARSVPEPAPAALDDATAAAARIAHPEPCDAAARASAATWFECIEALRRRGFVEAADAELVTLRAEFPDFRAPAMN